MTIRTDAHRPSEIIPSDYAYLMSFHTALTSEGFPIPPFRVQEALALYAERGAKVHPSVFQCDVCGAHYKEGELWEHTPSGQVISVGHDCAAKYSLLADDEAYHAEKAVRIQIAIREARVAQTAREVEEFLAARPGLADALKGSHHIVRDLAAKLARFGSLSGRQVDLALKIAAEEANRKPAAPKVDAPEGKQTIRGRVATVKLQEGLYGATLKMLVVVSTPEGEWKAWGSVPTAIRNVERGDIVEFSASVERSKDDAAFAFYKRPTKAEVVEEAAAA